MRRILIAGCVLLLLAGCASTRHRDKLRDMTLENYAAALRWGDIQGAWKFVDPAVRVAHPLTSAQKAGYANVRVAEYEATGPVATAEGTIEQTAHVTLIVKSSQHVYSVVDHQTWHWDAKAKRWWLESGLPNVDN